MWFLVASFTIGIIFYSAVGNIMNYDLWCFKACLRMEVGVIIERKLIA